MKVKNTVSGGRPVPVLCAGEGAYNVGVGAGWSVVGPAHKQRFLRYDGNGSADGAATTAVRYIPQQNSSTKQFLFCISVSQ